VILLQEICQNGLLYLTVALLILVLVIDQLKLAVYQQLVMTGDGFMFDKCVLISALKVRRSDWLAVSMAQILTDVPH